MPLNATDLQNLAIKPLDKQNDSHREREESYIVEARSRPIVV